MNGRRKTRERRVRVTTTDLCVWGVIALGMGSLLVLIGEVLALLGVARWVCCSFKVPGYSLLLALAIRQIIKLWKRWRPPPKPQESQDITVVG